MRPLTKDGIDLMKAADYMDRHGHCQNILEEGSSGRVCLYGAINAAINGDPKETSVRSFNLLIKVGKYMKPETSTVGRGLSAVEWNNKPERTKDEVVSLLRRAATVV